MLAEGRERQLLFTRYFLAPLTMSLSATTTPKAISGTGIERGWKGIQSQVNLEGWQWARRPASVWEPGASVTTPVTERKEAIVWGLWGHRFGALSLKVWPFFKERLGREEGVLAEWWLLSQDNSGAGSEGRVVALLFWRPAGFVCGPFRSVEPSCPSCFAWIPCISLPVSFPWFGPGTALGFYNWTTELLHFPPVSGDKSHWDVFVGSEMPHNAQMLWFLVMVCSLFLSRSFSVQPVRRVSRRVSLCEMFETSPVFADMSFYGFGGFFPWVFSMPCSLWLFRHYYFIFTLMRILILLNEYFFLIQSWAQISWQDWNLKQKSLIRLMFNRFSFCLKLDLS